MGDRSPLPPSGGHGDPPGDTGNDRALGFYLRTGAVELFRRPDRIGERPIVDIWPDPRTV